MGDRDTRGLATIPAVPEQVRAARVFVARVLRESHAHIVLAILLASELVTNSVLHSGSAVPGTVVTVRVTVTVAVAGEASGRSGRSLSSVRDRGQYGS